MITISLHPNTLYMDYLTDIIFRVANVEVGTCTNINLTVQSPPDILIVRGMRKLQIPYLDYGDYYDHALQLKARTKGVYSLSITNFSYRASNGEIIRPLGNFVSLKVIPAPTINKPTPSSIGPDKAEKRDFMNTPDLQYQRGLEMLNSYVRLWEEESQRDFNLFKAQLLENLNHDRRFGTTETLRNERARIIDNLNVLSLRLTDIRFTLVS